MTFVLVALVVFPVGLLAVFALSRLVRSRAGRAGSRPHRSRRRSSGSGSSWWAGDGGILGGLRLLVVLRVVLLLRGRRRVRRFQLTRRRREPPPTGAPDGRCAVRRSLFCRASRRAGSTVLNT
ncbi:hypothetical protein SF23_16535 [Streptomyces sp. MBRL 10]|nr:hypothetical protein SF23_16535 [Streptomyces sp. MBRL 10]